MNTEFNLEKYSAIISNMLKSSSSEPKSRNIKNEDSSYYICKWNENLFLHQNKEDIGITLAETFVLPDYSLDGIRYNDLNKKLDDFIIREIGNTMIIRGVPGIGKSSLASYIAVKYQDISNIVFIRFERSESEIIDLISNYKNVIVVVDSTNSVGKYLEFAKKYSFRVLILTRESINESNVITLEPFSKDQISMYYKKILNTEPLLDINYNLDILGNPLLLYIFISCGFGNLNYDIDCLYENVFGLYAGIYNRRILQTRFEHMHNLERVKEDIYLLCCQIAFKMFEENRNWLEKEEYFSIVKRFLGSYISLAETNVMITNGEKAEFIHKSIYDYYVASYIFDKLNDLIIYGEKKEIANIISDIFKQNVLSKEILIFLRYKINSNEIKEYFKNILETFELILQHGMSYFSDRPLLCAIQGEINIFCNMLEIIHLWELDNNITIKNTRELIFYIKHASISHIVLNLSKINLNNVNLSESDLSNADLSYANLSGAILTGCKMTKADLYCANLYQTNLSGVDFTHANLEQTNLTGANIENAKFQYAYLHYTGLESYNSVDTSFLGADVKGISVIEANSQIKDLFNREGKKTKIFISYTKNDIDIADKLDGILTDAGCIINRDTYNLKYWTSIKKYMQSIIDNDYIIMIISDEYLKSASCMNEILELMKMPDFKKHILPIVLDNRIYIIENQINYIGFWEDKCKRLKKRLKEIQIENLADFPAELRKYQDIASLVGKFLKVVTDIKNPSYNEMASALHELIYV